MNKYKQRSFREKKREKVFFIKKITKRLQSRSSIDFFRAMSKIKIKQYTI